MTEDGKERIAKWLARAGVCSRRDAERLIGEGRVQVDGAVLATPAFLVTGAEDIRVDGESVAAPGETRLFLYHKPAGLVTTARDERGRATVFDDLPSDMPRVVSVGRLDLNTGKKRHRALIGKRGKRDRFIFDFFFLLEK